MARPFSLEPQWRPAIKRWELSVPKSLSANGKRQRLFFEDRPAADRAVNTLRLRDAGEMLKILNFQRQVEAAEAFQSLERYHQATNHFITLREIVMKYIREHKEQYKSPTLMELYQQFLKRKPRSKKYLRQVEYCLKKFPGRETKMVSELTVEDIEFAFEGLATGNRNAYLRYIRSILNYGVKKGYLKENPVHRMDFAYRKRKAVHAIPNRLVKAMFEHALEHNPKFVRFLVLAFFCGVRSDTEGGEITKVRWNDFDLERKRLRLPAGITKTNKRRYIPLCDAAIAWLKRTESPFGLSSLVLSSFTQQTLRTAREANWEAVAEGKEWVHNGFRHTFASNFVAKYGIDDAREALGHDTRELTSQRYDAGIPKDKAEEFFSILPPTDKI